MTSTILGPQFAIPETEVSCFPIKCNLYFPSCGYQSRCY